jgi:uncharacterized protein YndB with AHSA1/START domain
MRSILLVGLLALSAPAAAEVVSSGPNGFEVREIANLVAPVPQAYAAFARIGSWWSGEHSYSGESANMRLDLRAGGCFCEQWKGGGVEHMRVAVVQPNERIVMTGALGPLLYEGASGSMDVQFERIAGGAKVTMTYRAGGFANGNGDKMAPLVDAVLGEQMKRFRTFAAKGGGKN